MTNAKTTKRALLSSIVSLILCFTMLLSTTYAWFTDTVTSANNIITAGNLDIELYHTNDNDTHEDVDDVTKLFDDVKLWEPGAVAYETFEIVNEGNLALKYQFAVNISNATKNEKGNTLADVLKVGVIDGAVSSTERTDLVAAVSEWKDFASFTESGKLVNTNEADIYTVVIYWEPSENDNEYNVDENNPLTIEIGVALLATQLTAENDSFDDQYDVNAGLYNKVVSSEEELVAALANAKNGDIIGISGNVTWTTGAGSGSTPFVPAAQTRSAEASKPSYITLQGVDENATFTAIGSGVGAIGIDNGTVIFKNLKIVDKSVSYAEDSWEFGYLEFRGTTVFENCDIVNAIMMEGTSATFKNCSFNSNKDSEYAVWVSNGDATFTNCYFTGTRGVKVHEAYGSEVGTVIIDNNKFIDLSKKPGLAIGDVNADATIKLTNNTFVGTQPGDQGNYKYETDTDTDNFNFADENNTVPSDMTAVDGIPGIFVDQNNSKSYYVFDKTGLMNLNKLFAKIQLGEGNTNTVNLMSDVDLAGEIWEPINAMWIIFNGNGHTISNLTAKMAADGRRSGFWAYAGAVTINDLTLENVNVSGSQVGAFVGAADGTKIDNCFLKGENTINFVADIETWNGVGAISGVTITSNINVEIVEGATITLNKIGFATDDACTYVDNLTGYIQANNGTVTNNGTMTVNQSVATADALKNALSSEEKNITVILANDISVDIGTGWKMGGADTESINIEGNGHVLTLSNTYRSYFNMANENGVLNLKNMTLTNMHSGTHFFDYTTHFNCDVVAENVIFAKSPLVTGGKKAVFTDCEFSQAGTDIYGLWIMSGSDVTVNGGELKTDRGFKITDEDSAQENTVLKVTKTKFNNSKKAAILVTTDYGAKITLDSLDITKCVADSTNAVWIDDGRTATADKIAVTGGTFIIEP